jgi:hypothetical protein
MMRKAPERYNYSIQYESQRTKSHLSESAKSKRRTIVTKDRTPELSKSRG